MSFGPIYLYRINLFYLSMHKLNLELKFCKMIAEIITHFVKIRQECFIIILIEHRMKNYNVIQYLTYTATLKNLELMFYLYVEK